MKRYQNPQIFEYLALSYAAGTLQGRARQRFENLMERHLYLRATTQAYQQKFNSLYEILPSVTPPPRVWSKLERELGLTTRQAHQQVGQPSLLARLKASLYWSAPAFASIAAAAMTALYLNMNTQPAAYVATLKSPQQDQIVVAMADKDEMTVHFEMLDKALPKHSDMTPTLWCISKNKNEPPIRMGTLTQAKGNQISLSQNMWKGLQDVSQFAISMEPANSATPDKPSGDIILSGDLKQLGKE